MKIFVIGDASSPNLGDPILTQSAAYLTEKVVKDIGESATVEVIDILPRKNNSTVTFTSSEKNSSFKAKKKLRISDRIKKILISVKIIVKWYLKDKKIFKNKIVQAVKNEQKCIFVIAGGALISSFLVYSLRLNCIADIAKKSGNKVIFNAVGIEKSVLKSFSKIYVKRMLKNPAVIAFSTRDHIEEIPYLTNRKEFKVRVADSGIYAAEVYNIKKSKSDVVGIGVISVEAYHSVVKENNLAANITENHLFEFWRTIIEQLEKEGTKWKIFTNGSPKDYAIALRFIEKYNYPKESLLACAKNPKELIEQISGFRAVAAHRLHALIIATSLFIPVVPIVWSDKVAKFAEVIGVSHLAQWPSLNSAITIAEKLNDKYFSVDYEIIEKLKQQSFDFIKNSLANSGETK